MKFIECLVHKLINTFKLYFTVRLKHTNRMITIKKKMHGVFLKKKKKKKKKKKMLIFLNFSFFTNNSSFY